MHVCMCVCVYIYIYFFNVIPALLISPSVTEQRCAAKKNQQFNLPPHVLLSHIV